MMASNHDPIRDAAIRTLLGCGPAAGPRAMLGLGEGPFDLDTLEAALATRRRAVQRNASSRGLAEEALELLETAAASLRPAAASTASTGGTPRPPIRPALPPENVPRPPGPIATRPKRPQRSRGDQPTFSSGPTSPVRPTPRITAAHLTAFDRLVLSILVSGGGWNARTRVLIAGLAHRAGMDATVLRRVVSGLASFMRQQGVVGTFGEMARAEAKPAPLPSPGRIESAMLRVAEGVGREFRGDSRSSLYKLVTLFGLLAVLFGVILVTALTAPTPGVRDTNQRRVEEERILTQRLEETTASSAPDGTHVVTPSTRPGVELPMTFARPPMFRGDRVPESVVLGLERLPSVLDDLRALAEGIRFDDDRLPEASKERWVESIRLLGGVWPRLPADDRSRVVEAVLSVLQVAESMRIADSLVAALEVDPDAAIREELDPWRRAFQGGILGEAVVRTELPEPVRENARRILQAFSTGDDGRHHVGGPFVAMGGRILDATGMSMAQQAGGSEPSLLVDAWERWFEAQSELRRADARQRALIGILELVLRLDQGLARGGLATDLLGRLVHEIDWTATGPDPEGLQDAYADWMRDDSIGSNAMWVLASILDGPAGIGWYRPEFVPKQDANDVERLGTLASTLDSWPRAQAPVARGEIVAVDAGLLAEVDRLTPLVATMIREASDDRELLEALLTAERLSLGITLLADDRAGEADQAIGLVAQHVDSDDVGIEFEQVGRPAVRSNDGEFAAAYFDAGQELEVRLDVLRSLLSEAVAGDLGELDAVALVREVWRGAPEPVRTTARSVVTDIFLHGANVAVALLDTVQDAPPTEDTAAFLELLTGESLPGPRDPAWELEIRRALARHAIRLLDPTSVEIDRLAEEIGATIEARAGARGGRPMGPIDSPAAAAAAAADSIRRVAEGLFLATGADRSIEDLDRSRLARRRLAPDEIRQVVAEHVSELEFLEFVLEARVPVRRDDLRRILADATDERGSADSGLRQAAWTVFHMVELERLRLVPQDGNPLGGYG